MYLKLPSTNQEKPTRKVSVSFSKDDITEDFINSRGLAIRVLPKAAISTRNKATKVIHDLIVADNLPVPNVYIDSLESAKIFGFNYLEEFSSFKPQPDSESLVIVIETYKPDELNSIVDTLCNIDKVNVLVIDYERGTKGLNLRDKIPELIFGNPDITLEYKSDVTPVYLCG